MKNVEFKMDVSIPLEAIEEVLITALEGGSNYLYWMDGQDVLEDWFDKKIEAGELKRNESVHYKWMDAMFQGCPHKIEVYDVEEAEWGDAEDYNELEPIGYLDLESIGKGLSLANTEGYTKCYKAHFPEYNDGDADTADVLFQLMTMGKVVYG